MFDHKEIGKRFDVFAFNEAAPGLPFLLGNGVKIKNNLIDIWRKIHERNDYIEIESPMMLDLELWKKSGHFNLYHDLMYYFSSEHRDFAIKPMNCPGAILEFAREKRSFKHLPLRICELGRVHRKEHSGSLSGMLRLRSFIVDDAHIFLSENQIEDEVKSIVEMAMSLMYRCGFKKYSFELSVRGNDKKEKYLGDDKVWKQAESSIAKVLDELGLPYSVGVGEAKFYGPSLDLHIEDSKGKKWQCSSIQLDFNLAQRFNISYFDEDGSKRNPVIIHRCLYGAIERFIAILLESYGMRLPAELRPYHFSLIELPGVDSGGFQSGLKKLGYRYKLIKVKRVGEGIKKSHQLGIVDQIVFGDKELEKEAREILNDQLNLDNA